MAKKRVAGFQYMLSGEGVVVKYARVRPKRPVLPPKKKKRKKVAWMSLLYDLDPCGCGAKPFNKNVGEIKRVSVTCTRGHKKGQKVWLNSGKLVRA